MHRVVAALQRLVGATVIVAGLGALVGFLVTHFAGWTGGVQGVGWGMLAAGALVGLLAGGSGSPSDNLVRGRMGAFGTYWGESSPLPQSPLELALGGLLAFVAGIALLALAG